MRCGWCETNNNDGTTNCVNCGGPLPGAAGSDPGPAPPPAPRTLPAIYVKRALYTRNFGAIFGSIFGGIGCLLGVVFLVVGLFFPPLLLGLCIISVFPLVGGGIGWTSYQKARSRVETLKSGRVAQGQVVSVDKDTTVAVNGRNPWRLTYLFEVEGARYQGSASSFDANMTRHEPGQAVHVVYLPQNPERNAPWPPIA